MEKLKEKIVEGLTDCGGKFSIIPLLGFDKWIVIVCLNNHINPY